MDDVDKALKKRKRKTGLKVLKQGEIWELQGEDVRKVYWNMKGGIVDYQFHGTGSGSGRIMPGDQGGPYGKGGGDFDPQDFNITFTCIQGAEMEYNFEWETGFRFIANGVSYTFDV